MKPPLVYALLIVLLNACFWDQEKSPGKPLVAIDFNGDVQNSGLSNVLIQGDSLVSYYFSDTDTCLNLSATAKFRKPLSVYTDNSFTLDDYEGFTVSVWVKKAIGDQEEYSIVSQQYGAPDIYSGWIINASKGEGWSWKMSDGKHEWMYSPTSERQTISDGEWHHLAFSFHRAKQEGRIYFDGRNVAVYSLWDIDLSLFYAPFVIGVNPFASDVKMETFNGLVDDFGLWSRPLADVEISRLYKDRTRKRLPKEPVLDEELKVMTWNIWHGGRHEGKQVGVNRVVEIIKNAGADIVLLQETYGSGEKIADALNYHYYYRSSNLSVVSRYPFLDSYNMFRPFNFGSVLIDLGKERSLLACPVWLHYLPNIGAYVKSGNAISDSIIAREMETRGLEAKLMLSELRQFIINQDEVPLVVGGDFNSGSHLDWTDRNHGNYYGLTVQYPVSDQMIRAGFYDSYREKYPDETVALGQTWSPVFKSSMQDRIDYIYYTGRNLKVVDSQVIDDHPLGFPSDHAAVLTTFLWEKMENE